LRVVPVLIGGAAPPPASAVPGDLADLAQLGIAPEPDLLLAALVLAAGPVPGATEQLAVVFDLDGFGRLRLESAPGRLALGGIFGASPAATLHTTPAQLPAVLAGTQEPEAATAGGDLEALQTLLRHLDDAQRRER
jgi:hypothetical protein